ncbi:MAG TPA: PLP-dependent aminotransferase family protein [Vicinamibacterales bacterium]|nr:PLP-dependent aminotransferase family protein [Vicinamibacterales bacterium]
MRTPIVVDRRLAAPLHRQIYEQWRAGILGGRFAPGDRMPSTRELAVALRVSRATVATAYDQLMAEGYLDTQHGSGTFVCRDLPDVPVRAAAEAPLARTRAANSSIRVSAFASRLEPVQWRVPAAPRVINLSTDGPTFDQFPFAVWKRLVRRHLQVLGPSLFQYASDGAGHPALRETLAAYLSRSRAVRCAPEQILVANGSQQALDLCARVLVDPGDDVAVEDPGYGGARELFAAVGTRLRPVPVDGDGLVVSALPPSARLVYITPSHQFPLGVSMSLARRLELVEWARAHRAVIVEDDYDSEYRYSGAPLPALQGLSADAGVVYVGTFSNVMFPGLRLGYLVLPPDLVEPFHRAKWLADRHTAHLEQAALADFIREGHMERHIRRMRRVYKRRREAFLDAVSRAFGDRATVAGDASGMHLVVRFDAAGIAAHAARRSVHLVSTRRYYAGHAPPHEFIVRFTGVSERAIREAVKRLAG